MLVAVAKDAASNAESRLSGMVNVTQLHSYEAETKTDRDELNALEREARQLRVALADAISNGNDMPTMLNELETLKQSAAGAAARMKSLEDFNRQLEDRLKQVKDDIQRLRKGTVDLRSEGELMRDVIVQQSEQLVRRVEDLTEEKKTADFDRRQLLATTAELLEEVDGSQARIARKTTLEDECNRFEASQENLNVEVQRLRRTNEAMCQQVLGEDAEGPFAGALLTSRRAASLDLQEEDAELLAEVSRLVRGQLLKGNGRGGPHVQADAAGLALRIQQVLAAREESFWVERQRLSERVTTLERARGGRTGNLLRQYDTAARGSSAQGRGASSASSGITGYAAAGRDAASAAAGAAAGVVSGGLSFFRSFG
eukprot:TRINITY_DN4298_c0_g1_i10.p1 TRINITY_DN4298_c0_g1~~TRINITY_DN4298_c0_g1_i10.p1  ORF type:complete len:371 (+),score=118.81 TRINITY_DN4298_c0_g1_i10:1522-2634(+)